MNKKLDFTRNQSVDVPIPGSRWKLTAIWNYAAIPKPTTEVLVKRAWVPVGLYPDVMVWIDITYSELEGSVLSLQMDIFTICFTEIHDVPTE